MQFAALFKKIQILVSFENEEFLNQITQSSRISIQCECARIRVLPSSIRQTLSDYLERSSFEQFKKF